MEKKHFYSLDILRFLAASEIAFFYHYIVVTGAWINNNSNAYSVASELTDVFVLAFFIISGFFLEQKWGQGKNGCIIRFDKYLFNIIKRLYPLMISSVIMMTVFQWINKLLFGYYAILNMGDARNTPYALILSLIGINCGWICDGDILSINGVTWYISILLICYIIYYLIFWSTKNLKQRVFVCALFSALGAVLTIHPLQVFWLYFNNGRGYMSFFGGVILSVLCRETNILKMKKTILTILFISLFLSIYICKNKLFMGHHNLIYTYLDAPIIILFLLSLNKFNKYLESKWIKFLGDISYSIYLFNLPTMAAFVTIANIINIKVDFSDLSIWGFVVVLTILVAILFQKMLNLMLDILHR